MKIKSIILSTILLFMLKTANGQTRNICSLNNIPGGWVVTNVIQHCKCCGSTNGTQWTIQYIEKMPVGSQVTLCVFANVPQGWKVLQNNHCTCCGATAPNAGNQWVIKRIK